MELFPVKSIRGWAVFAILLAVCSLTYSNSLHSPFMMDDQRVYSDVKLKNVKFILNSFIYPTHGLDSGEAFNCSGQYYRPMDFVIFMLSYLAFGDEPFGYHLLDLFLFTLMCFTLYVFIDFCFKDKILAIITSILFAVHPINVFYVNYNTSSIHSVRFIFMFISVIFFLKAWEGGHRNIFYAISLLCFGVALLCHETSMVLPFYILFTSIFISKQDMRKGAVKTWPFFSMLLLYLFFRFCYTSIPGNLSSGFLHLNAFKIISIIAAFSKLIYLYFASLLFPGFVFFCWNVLLSSHFIVVWIGGLIFLFAGWAVLLRANAKSVPFFCATWLLLGFLPVTVASMSSPELGLIVEPQWLTFSSMGFFLFIAWGWLRLYARVNKILMYLVLISLLIGWGMGTRYNNWIWGDEIRYLDYWLGSIEGHASIQNNHMGDVYLNKGNYVLARYYYLKVLQLGDPQESVTAYNNLGLIDLHQGYLDRARKEFLSSIKSDPDNYFALNNLALIYLKQGDTKSARSFLLRSLKFNKYSIETRLNLASIDEKESNYKEALSLYNENLNTVPYEERSLWGLIRVYIRMNDTADIIKYSQQLIEHGRDPAMLTNLGSQLGAIGQPSLASDAFSQAIRIDPKYKEAYLEAGKLLANARMYKEAIRIWQIGEEIDPKDQRYKDNILKAEGLGSIFH